MTVTRAFLDLGVVLEFASTRSRLDLAVAWSEPERLGRTADSGLAGTVEVRWDLGSVVAGLERTGRQA